MLQRRLTQNVLAVPCFNVAAQVGHRGVRHRHHQTAEDEIESPIRAYARRLPRPCTSTSFPTGGSPPTILLRESIRDGKRVRKRTIANLSALPIEQAEMIRRVLKGEKLGPLESALDLVRSQAHGHVEAVLTAMRRFGLVAPEKAQRMRSTMRAYTDVNTGEPAVGIREWSPLN
jgi:hypothetical protein